MAVLGIDANIDVDIVVFELVALNVTNIYLLIEHRRAHGE